MGHRCQFMDTNVQLITHRTQRQIADSLTERSNRLSRNFPDLGRITGYPNITRQGGDNVRVADHPEVALNSVCDHPAAAGIYPQSALSLGTFA
jgi:hypothetical protein